MRLNVSHTTRYAFDRPLRGVIQSHRLTPSQFEGQTVVHWQVEAPGGIRGASFRDGAGDWVETMSFRGPVEAVDISVTGLVETRDMTGVLRGHKETVRPLAYLRETRLTRPDLAIEELASETLAALEGTPTPLDQSHALSAAIAAAVEYRPGRTETATTAAEALALGEGVCQDHAHLMIAAARSVGLPARYVSGYLFSGEGDQSAEASHAWCEIWVGGLGWVGFDASNECCPDERYVRLGSGLDAEDGAPIRGVSEGIASEALEVVVAVESIQQ